MPAQKMDAAFKAWLLLAPSGTLIPADAHDDLMDSIPTMGFVAWNLDDGVGAGYTLRALGGKLYFERDAQDSVLELAPKGTTPAVLKVRRLTVGDRSPCEGDVVETPDGKVRMRSDLVGRGLPYLRPIDDKGNEVWPPPPTYGYAPTNALVYVSRADGGPVTKEEP